MDQQQLQHFGQLLLDGAIIPALLYLRAASFQLRDLRDRMEKIESHTEGIRNEQLTRRQAAPQARPVAAPEATRTGAVEDDLSAKDLLRRQARLQGLVR